MDCTRNRGEEVLRSRERAPELNGESNRTKSKRARGTGDSKVNIDFMRNSSGVMVHTFHLSGREAETGRSQGPRPAYLACSAFLKKEQVGGSMQVPGPR